MASQELRQYYAELTPRHSVAGEVDLYYREQGRYAATLPLRRLCGEELLLEVMTGSRSGFEISPKYELSSDDGQDQVIRTINFVLNGHSQLATRHEKSLEVLWASYRTNEHQFRNSLNCFIGNLYE